MQWAAVAAVFTFAGLVKGLIGLGLPTVAMGLLGSFMPPAQAAALLIVPSLVTNVWQMLAGGALFSLVRRLWTLQAGIVAGTLWAPVSVSTLDGRIAAGGLGLCLVAYAALGLAAVHLRVPVAQERWASPGVGLATGIVTAATGVFVLPAVPYLQGLRLGKDELVQGLGLSFTVSTLALAGRLLADGSPALGTTSVVAWLLPLLVALLGMSIGTKLRSSTSDQGFARMFFGGLAVVGAGLMIKNVSW